MRTRQEVLQEALDKRQYIWLHGPDFTFMGFVLGLSDSLVLIHRFRDFAENGYAIVRLGALEAVDHGGKSLQFFESMMRAEGILSHVGIELAIPLSSQAAALTAIQRQGALVLLTLDTDEGSDTELNVGELLNVDDLHTRIRFLTAWGEWCGEVVLETLAIARIEFGTPYLEALLRHSIRATPPSVDN